VVLVKSAIDALRSGTLPELAARAGIETLGARVGGMGGLILVDRLGRLGLARSTASMSWAAQGLSLGRASGV
jgi:beta-aspartyl-peptidase (threonine type)